jgi:catechol 2,3-dioxygenase-like lactoylglutathione lyase family enzyme
VDRGARRRLSEGANDQAPDQGHSLGRSTSLSRDGVEAGINQTPTTTAKRGVRTVDMKLEIVSLPVADVDRAKEFYKSLGWREDVDVVGDEDFRAVQLTPPGSAASIHFGSAVSKASGTVQNIYLAVTDIEAARAELVEHGADVTEIFHDADGGLGLPSDPAKRARGLDPERRSYASYATFSDPDGNGWVLQELTTRLPGR